MDTKMQPSKLSLIIASLLAANGAIAAESKTFAPLPLAAKQSESSTSASSKTAPNIMFIFDDTSSMRTAYRNRASGSSSEADPDADSTDTYTKTYFMKKAVRAIANDKEFQDANYYAMDICGTGGGVTEYRDSQGNKVFDYDTNTWKKNPRPSYQKPEVGKPLTGMEGLKKLKDYVNSITPNNVCGGNTDHLIEAYYEALYFMRKNMNEASNQYRCTVNAIILITDSATNETNIRWDENGVATANQTNAIKSYHGTDTATYYWFNTLSKGAGKWPKEYWDCPTREYWSQYGYDTGNSYAVPTRGQRTEMVPYYDWLDRYNNQQCRFIYSDDWNKYSKYEKNRTFSGISSEILGKPAQYTYSHPLVDKDTALRPVDAAGVAWDAPIDPNNSSPDAPKWPRNIVTYSVGFPYVNGESSQTGTTDFNLINPTSSGNNNTAFSASDDKQLVDALKKALGDIKSRGNFSIPTGYSYTSPAALGTDKLIEGVGVYLNNGMTRTNLKITAFVDDKFDIDNIKTPSFNSNRLFLKWQKPVNSGGRKLESAQFYNLGDTGSRAQLANTIKSSIDTFNTVFGMPSDSVDAFKNGLGKLLANPNENIGDGYRVYDPEFPMGNVIDSPVVPGGKLSGNLQNFLVTSANDGMTYIFKYDGGDAKRPYALAYRYLPLQMDRSTTWEGTDTIGNKLYGVFRENYAQPGGPQRVWLNNGGITVRSIKSRQDSNEQQTFMVGSPAQGGRGVFALQIGGKDLVSGMLVGASKQSISGSDVIIFETPKGWNNDLGYVFGNPTIARLSLCRKDKNPLGAEPSITDREDLQTQLSDEASIVCPTVSNTPPSSGTNTSNSSKLNLSRGIFYSTLYGSGFNYPGQLQSALNIRQIFPQDVGLEAKSVDKIGIAGTLIRSIKIPDNYSGLAMPAVIDMDYDGIVDIAYAATQDGKMYRFDLRGDSPQDWKAYHIFSTQEKPKLTLKDSQDPSKGINKGSEQRQPVTIAPNVYRFTKQDKTCYMVMFGTGSNIYESDLADRTVQSIYGIADCPDDLTTPVVKISDLLERNLSTDGDTRLVDRITQKDDSKKGWYADLNSLDSHGINSGERIVTTPIIVTGSAIYSSVSYATDTTKIDDKTPKNDPCKVTSTNIESGSKGWLMVFTALHGDEPTDNGASLERLDNKNKKFEQNSSSVARAVGVAINSATNYTLFTIRDGKEQQSALTPDGNVVSGLDNELNPDPAPDENNCMTEAEAASTKLIGQSREGLQDGFKLTPKICKEAGDFNLLRLNLREINF